MARSIYNTKPLHRKLLLLNISFIFLVCLFLNAYLHPPSSDVDASTNVFNHARMLSDISVDGCSDLHKYLDNDSKCLYVKSHAQCRSKGYINYLQIFYCSFGHSPFLGHALLILWLVILFYLLGDTASNYFCSNLEGLSNILRLSPTIAGVTLLSLGNGAPDFFASVVSFTRSNDGAVGLNSILGGAFFVSSAVLGIISFLVSANETAIDKASFIRDVIFFLFSLFILLVIISIGKISLLGSIFYVSIYFLYVCAVSATHFIYGGDRTEGELGSSSDDLTESGVPLLGCVDDEKPNGSNKEVMEDQGEKHHQGFGNNSFDFTYLSKFLHVLELPLCLPRRLTIPVVSEEGWSKPYAVISVTLAPVLFSALCNTQMENESSRSSLVSYLTAALIGIVLGNMACVTTKSTSPPRKCLFPWLAGGFSMSVTWTYIIAEELVSLLVAIGNVIGVSPSILGLTVLAWGNSLGDLIANGAMAKNGGADGAQIAVSGCYAGPMFNILMGLGLPLLLSAWSEYPESYVIPKDPSLFATLLFLMGGVLWALVILTKKNMKLDKSLGIGLLTIYLCFLFIRMVIAIGVIKF
ncbi:cation/calcium exchanger 1-like [Vigna radiata var. radiata]|uniref:Cation/calcium exchanger 1-like n=1 Tax=Vigna radiata var. radiata TaxID=3916 RepID=A0A1S3TQC9_VIGRR|nr:cation/calcium exchanger 1-like [Vigna radiata var. radiata]